MGCSPGGGEELQLALKLGREGILLLLLPTAAKAWHPGLEGSRQPLDHLLPLPPQAIESHLNLTLAEDLGEALADGVILCQLANRLCPRSVPFIHVPSPAVVSFSLDVHACVWGGEYGSYSCSRAALAPVAEIGSTWASLTWAAAAWACLAG